MPPSTSASSSHSTTAVLPVQLDARRIIYVCVVVLIFLQSWVISAHVGHRPSHPTPSTISPDCPTLPGPCPPGHEATCNGTCRPCPPGTYRPRGHSSSRHTKCVACSLCGEGLYETRPCTGRHDVKCNACTNQAMDHQHEHARRRSTMWRFYKACRLHINFDLVRPLIDGERGPVDEEEIHHRLELLKEMEVEEREEQKHKHQDNMPAASDHVFHVNPPQALKQESPPADQIQQEPPTHHHRRHSLVNVGYIAAIAGTGLVIVLVGALIITKCREEGHKQDDEDDDDDEATVATGQGFYQPCNDSDDEVNTNDSFSHQQQEQYHSDERTKLMSDTDPSDVIVLPSLATTTPHHRHHHHCSRSARRIRHLSDEDWARMQLHPTTSLPSPGAVSLPPPVSSSQLLPSRRPQQMCRCNGLLTTSTSSLPGYTGERRWQIVENI